MLMMILTAALILLIDSWTQREEGSVGLAAAVSANLCTFHKQFDYSVTSEIYILKRKGINLSVSIKIVAERLRLQGEVFSRLSKTPPLFRQSGR